MRSAASACAGAPTWPLSDRELSAALLAVHAAEQALLAAKLHLVHESVVRGVPTGGTARWLSDHLRLGATVARRLVALARAVDARPGVDDALAAGQMDGQQAAAVTTALDELPTDVGPEIVGKAEAMLIGWAGEFPAPAVRKLAERVLAHVAPEVADAAEARYLARQEEHAHAARTLSLRSIGAGRHRLSGVLDSEAAAIITAALDPLCSPRRPHPGVPPDNPAAGAPIPGGPVAGSPVTDGPVAASQGSTAGSERLVDERSPGQRRADALLDVCRLALATTRLPANGGDRPQLTVTIPYDPLARTLGTGTLDTGERISATQVRRLACDAQLLPAVLGGPGQVLDVGQSRRLFTGALRRALTLRDGGCAFPGCDRPSRWCDGHHIRSWIDGGPTSLGNAVLLCRRHHRVIHHDGWSVHLAADGLPRFVPPAHLDPLRRPRRNVFHDRR